MRRIVNCANAYIHKYRIRQEVQYDVFSITGNPYDYKLEHIPDAFFPNLRVYR
jgi:putative endonuclease